MIHKFRRLFVTSGSTFPSSPCPKAFHQCQPGSAYQNNIIHQVREIIKTVLVSTVCLFCTSTWSPISALTFCGRRRIITDVQQHTYSYPPYRPTIHGPPHQWFLTARLVTWYPLTTPANMQHAVNSRSRIYNMIVNPAERHSCTNLSYSQAGQAASSGQTEQYKLFCFFLEGTASEYNTL